MPAAENALQAPSPAATEMTLMASRDFRLSLPFAVDGFFVGPALAAEPELVGAVAGAFELSGAVRVGRELLLSFGTMGQMYGTDHMMSTEFT